MTFDKRDRCAKHFYVRVGGHFRPLIERKIQIMSDNIIAQEKTKKPDIFDRIMRRFCPKKFLPLYEKYKEMLLYCFFGLLTTVVSFIFLGIPQHLLMAAGLSKSVAVVPSNVISWICAVTFAYVTNRIWVFDNTADTKKGIMAEIVSFYGGRFITLLVETFMMWAGVHLLDMNLWITKILASIVVFILNYIISKVIVFRHK